MKDKLDDVMLTILNDIDNLSIDELKEALLRVKDDGVGYTIYGMDELSKLDQENGLYDNPKFISDMALCGGTGERVAEDNTVHVIMAKQRQRMENLITLSKDLTVSQEYVDNLKVRLSEEKTPVITQEFLNRTYRI